MRATRKHSPPTLRKQELQGERERSAHTWDGTKQMHSVLRALNCLEESKNIN